MIADAFNVVASTDPTGGRAAWTVSRVETVPPRTLIGVVCGSVSMCVAYDTAGAVWTSGDPAGGAAAWTRTPVDPSSGRFWGITGASCPSARACVVGDSAGNVLTSMNPTGGPGAWKFRDLHQGFNPIQALSCPTASLCVGYDGAGNIVSSERPAARRAAWRVFQVGTAVVGSVDCLPTPFCFGVDAAGEVLTSGNPAGGPGAWTVTRVDPAHAARAVSCASPSFCVAVESDGYVAVSTDPNGGAAAWSASLADTDLNIKCTGPGTDCDPGLESVACPSRSACAAIDANANILTTTQPAGGAPWNRKLVGAWSFDGTIICPSTSLCVRSGSSSSGNVSSIAAADRPFDQNATWTQPRFPTYHSVSRVSCRSASLCVAGDTAGDVLTSRHPAGGAAAWKSVALEPGESLTVDCAARGLCVAIDPLGNAFTASDPVAGRRAWGRASVDADPLTAATCPSSTFCVAVDGQGQVAIGRARRAR